MTLTLIKLHDESREPIWINPARVTLIRTRLGGGCILVFPETSAYVTEEIKYVAGEVVKHGGSL